MLQFYKVTDNSAEKGKHVKEGKRAAEKEKREEENKKLAEGGEPAEGGESAEGGEGLVGANYIYFDLIYVIQKIDIYLRRVERLLPPRLDILRLRPRFFFPRVLLGRRDPCVFRLGGALGRPIP